MLPNRVQCGSEEIHVAYARDLDRVLKRQEHTFARALFRKHREQVLAFIDYFAQGHFVALAAGEDMSKRALARPIRAHDGVNFTGLHLEIDPSQDFILIDVCM